MESCNLGLIGLAVMGKNLALNIESRGFSIAVYNRTTSITEEFVGQHKDKKISGAKSLEEFVSSLDKPKKIIIMVKAGEAVDLVISQLLPFLEKGDVIADAGNSFFKDTVRRSKMLEEKGLYFVGTGVSGGEEGALKGPSIMVGGSEEAWKHLQPFLEKIAAKAFDGSPCCAYLGTDGSGHYVKMIHNGIEYIDMQLISEAYHLLKEVGLSNEEISNIFDDWNKGRLNSYLIEITSKILRKRDSETGEFLVDVILDEAEHKGTGKWASQDSLDLGVPVYSLNTAVLARFMSSLKKERVAASKLIEKNSVIIENKERFVQQVHDALYASKICAYAQGFALLSAASKEYNWSLNLKNIAHIWEGGCIIRAKFLENVKSAFDKNTQNLMMDNYFFDIIKESENSWRDVVTFAVRNKIPIPGFSSALTYYDSYFSERLPANLIQAQRDFFGAHTYKRTDKDGVFHSDWND
ncbi:MAG: NADP-dependent phosphogluconate dehydrogenase [Candidatus Aenigmarchaeota archaeon]|nr:NADP-dependent phosphogluconate dehydrogenase [Candidatus Aenigmarchaeota archaeon]